jgi:hypothetical protein
VQVYQHSHYCCSHPHHDHLQCCWMLRVGEISSDLQEDESDDFHVYDQHHLRQMNPMHEKAFILKVCTYLTYHTL